MNPGKRQKDTEAADGAAVRCRADDSIRGMGRAITDMAIRRGLAMGFGPMFEPEMIQYAESQTKQSHATVAVRNSQAQQFPTAFIFIQNHAYTVLRRKKDK